MRPRRGRQSQPTSFVDTPIAEGLHRAIPPFARWIGHAFVASSSNSIFARAPGQSLQRNEDRIPVQAKVRPKKDVQAHQDLHPLEHLRRLRGSREVDRQRETHDHDRKDDELRHGPSPARESSLSGRHRALLPRKRRAWEAPSARNAERDVPRRPRCDPRGRRGSPLLS